MNPTFRHRGAVFAAALAICSTAFCQDGVILKQRWQAGKRYTQSMDMEQSMHTSAGGEKIDQGLHIVTDVSLTVRSHEDGIRKRLVLKYERMKMETELGSQKTSVDSAKPAAGKGAPPNPLAAIVGKEIRAITDENDKVVGFENLDELSALAGSNPVTSALLSKESLARMINQNALQALPSTPVKPGDSWPFSVDVPLPRLGSVEIKGRYTFSRVTPHKGVSCAEIAIDGQVSLAVDTGATTSDGNSLAQLGLKVKNGFMKGTIWFDNALGAARGTKTTQEMTMSIKDPSNPAESMNIPIRQVISTEMIKVEDVK